MQRGIEIGLLDGDATVRKTVAMAVIEFVLAQGGSDALSETSLRTYYEENKHLFAPANRLQVAQIFILYGDSPDDAAVIAQWTKCAPRCGAVMISPPRRRPWARKFCRPCRA